MIQKLFSLVLLCAITTIALAQMQFTPYDELPGIDKSYKPTYSEHYHSWQKMLYQYPVNFNQINQLFQTDIQNNPQQKTPILRYYKIWSRVVNNYTNENGEIVIPNLESIQNKQLQAQQQAYSSTKSGTTGPANWTFLGPKETFWRNETNFSPNQLDENGAPKQCPWQANVYAFDVAPSDNNILYCGTETGFVNKTNNKGLSWELLGINYPFGGGVPAIAIHPKHPDTVYVSAGEQVHKTNDGGKTWTPLLAQNKRFSASRLKINPTNPNHIIAGSLKGFYHSTDAGASWSKKWSRPVWDVEFNPANSDEIYAITKSSSGIFQVIVSNDGGTSFTLDNNFPSNIEEQSGGLLAISPANSAILYATLLAKERDGDAAYILKGTKSNDGFTWEQTKKGDYRPPNTHGGGEFNVCQGYFDLVLEASPTNPDVLFFGTCSFWKSTDGGYTFNKIGGYGGDFPVHPDIQDLKVLENGETWLATDGGMNYSSDLFTSIENYASRTNGIIGSDMWGFDQGWNEDIVVGGRYHNGNTAIADFYGTKALRMGGAESPTGWVIKGKSRHVAFDDLGNGWILPKTAEGIAEGRFIFSKFPNMEEYGGRRSNMVHHPNYYGTIYVGRDNALWKSTNSGESFDLLFQFPNKVRYFNISHKNPEVMYADIVNEGLYRSNDGGKTWTHKPAISNGSAGNSYWKGRLFFVISPYDENKIYACLQNGTWSNDIGEIYRSTDGGTSWANWTAGLQEYTKCMVIQPTNIGQDLVYLFTQSKNGESSKVYYRYEQQPYWNDFNANYPAGKKVNLALPFYRDGKIRVAGNAGVWESPLAEEDFSPIPNPWIEKQVYNCMSDTLYFDDHSILNHTGTSWEWSISPEPEFISDNTVRNPKVVLGSPGSYDVTLKLTKNGESYEKTITEMVSTSTCPSVDDCSNPAEVDIDLWSLLYVDSEETAGEDGKAINAFDGNPETFWHSEWYHSTPGQPHELQIDMSREYLVSEIKYLPRQNSSNGRIKSYELYVSTDKTDWGTPVKSGDFSNNAGMQSIKIAPTTGRYLRFKSLSEQNGNKFTTIAELAVVGCIDKDITSITQERIKNLNAFPIPATQTLNVSIPLATISQKLSFSFYAITSEIVKSGTIDHTNGKLSFDVSGFNSGTYILALESNDGQVFRVKFIKN